MVHDLQGKTALVTGAASGIGLEVAKALAAARANVIAADVDEHGLKALPDGLDRSAVGLDVTDPDAWAAAAETVTQRHGRLDILVNNAGVICNKAFLSTDLGEFRRIMKINVEGTWLGLQSMSPLLKIAGADGGASVVNMSSVYGMVGSPSNAAYSASKGAIRLLTKSVAAEFALRRTGIRVNSLHPGPTETPLLTEGFDEIAQRRKSFSAKDARDTVVGLIPMGRLGNTQEIAQAVLFLASPQSSFMTGSELVVDGGYSSI